MPWCCPWIDSATISSAPPSPYISAVSIKLMPSSIPKRSAATSLACALLLSPMRHVPCPSTGTRLPSDSATVLISIQSHLESAKAEVTFAPEAFTPASPIKEWTYGVLAGKSSVVCRRSARNRRESFSLACDCAQSFNQRLALCAIVDNECVVFAMRRPRATRHFIEIHEPPVADVGWFQSEVIAHGG